MGVVHILKDGTRVDDITGHVVRMEDAENLYRMIRRINRKTNESRTDNREPVKEDER